MFEFKNVMLISWSWINILNKIKIMKTFLKNRRNLWIQRLTLIFEQLTGFFYIFYIVKLNYIYFVLIYIFSFVFNVLWKFVSLCTLFASLAEKKEDGGVGNWWQGWIIFEKNRQKKKKFSPNFLSHFWI